MRKIAAFLLICTCLTGCKKEAPPKRAIGVIPKGANHIFWKSVHAGAVKAARENNLEVEWNAPTLEIDSARQITIMESMINRRLDGIALAPVDRKALVSVVERATRTGIPVVIFDSDLDSKERVSYVATNNREGGRLAARALAESMLEKGKVAIIGFMAGSASTMERDAGFQEELKANHPDIKVVQTVFGMASQAKAMAATENVLTAHPDLGGLFANNESSSMGAVLALKARLETRVRLVAFDASPQLVDDLRHKHIDALVIQDPFKMGYESARAIAMKLRGEQPPDYIDSGVRLVRRGDLERPEVIPLIYPDIKRYLGETEGH